MRRGNAYLIFFITLAAFAVLFLYPLFFSPVIAAGLSSAGPVNFWASTPP